MNRPTVQVTLALISLAWIAMAAADPDSGVLRLGNVDFPHEMHYADLELECSSCHHETHAGELDIPHPEYFADFWIRCATCHAETAAATGPVACSACHHGSPVDIADETLSVKVVIHRSCWQCHEVGTGAQASQACVTCHMAGSPPSRRAASRRGETDER